MKIKSEILLKLNALLLFVWAVFIFLFKLPNVDHPKLYAPYSVFIILLIILGVGNIKSKRWSALLSLFLIMPLISSIQGGWHISVAFLCGFVIVFSFMSWKSLN